MARDLKDRGYIKRHKKRIFRNQLVVGLRDSTYRYVQEHRKRLDVPISHFIDYAINELMKKAPPQFTKRQYLNEFIVDDQERREGEANYIKVK